MATTPTLLEMHHPSFIDGYHKGRMLYFENREAVTDMNLVESLTDLFNEPSTPSETEEERIHATYYLVGQLLGQISALVIARQPHEDTRQERQQALLQDLRRKYGTGKDAKALVSSVARWWTIADQLAQTLDESEFQRVLHRNLEPVYKVIED